MPDTSNEPTYDEPRPGTPPPRRHWWDGFVAPISEEERRTALADPGPSWTEYIFWQYLKWIFGLFVLIVDSLLILTFLVPLGMYSGIPALGTASYLTFALDILGGILSLAAAVYLEYLLWQYLWHRPSLESGHDRRAARDFRRSWYRPFRFGRWTPEAKLARQGVDVDTSKGIDRKEFL